MVIVNFDIFLNQRLSVFIKNGKVRLLYECCFADVDDEGFVVSNLHEEKSWKISKEDLKFIKDKQAEISNSTKE